MAAGTDANGQLALRVGLCATCAHARRITSGKGSTFWMCQSPTRPKYPPLPVVRCMAFSELPPPPSTANTTPGDPD